MVFPPYLKQKYREGRTFSYALPVTFSLLDNMMLSIKFHRIILIIFSFIIHNLSTKYNTRKNYLNFIFIHSIGRL